MPRGRKQPSYNDYYDFSKGYNDTSAEDSLDKEELVACENTVVKENGALHVRNGTSKLNAVSKGYEITRRFEYLIRNTSRVLETYDKKLYRTGSTDTLLTALSSDRPVFLQQQDVLYAMDGSNIYEIGQKDYFSNIGTVDIKLNDIVQIADDFTGSNGVIGHFYQAKAVRTGIDLKADNYTDTANWSDVTDIVGATSSVVRPITKYETLAKEVAKLSLFGTTQYAGTITLSLNGNSYNFSLATGLTAANAASAIKTSADTSMASDYDVTVSDSVVTFSAKVAGAKKDAVLSSNTTGITVVLVTTTQGKDDDNIFNEVSKCTKFARHTKSARYVATGNPQKPYAVYFSEPNQINYWKNTNVLSPISSEGSPECLLNMLDSILVGYKTSWYEYTGIDPATDGTWKRLALPFGCIAGKSVQQLDLYNFVYLGQNGLNVVNSNILNQYGYIVQNNSGVKSISNKRIEKTIKSIKYPEKCVSVYHDSIYYLAFCDEGEKNNKILTYDTDYKAFTVFNGINANDLLYKFDGSLEIASKNYSLLYDEKSSTDVNVETGEPKKIEFTIQTGKLNQDAICDCFFDKLFIKCKQYTDNINERIKVIVKIDDTEITEPLIPMATPPYLQTIFLRQKGVNISLCITNKDVNALTSQIFLYGFSVSFMPFIPYQYTSNNHFSE